MKRHLKDFDASQGLQLDPSFDEHAKRCDSCALVDRNRPATLAHACLEGSVLYKRDHPEKPRRERVERPDTYATKAQVKALTRYKGE